MLKIVLDLGKKSTYIFLHPKFSFSQLPSLAKSEARSTDEEYIGGKK